MSGRGRTLTRIRASLRWRLFSRRITRLQLEPSPWPIVYLGSGYGGYGIPDGVITPDWTCYCIGTGRDITFDLALIDRYGCEVFACDPAPEAEPYVREAAAGVERFSFLPVAVGPQDGTSRLYRSADPAHMALSTGDLEGTGETVEVPMRSLPSLMREFGHERIDLIKLAVEGLEYELLESIKPAELGARVLLVEFTWSRPAAAAFKATEALRAQGYLPVYRNVSDVTFVHETAVQAAREEVGTQ
ncbi:MAG TPA: FkbM family methyltransferase [Thermoleophilaceae bacterium]